MNIAIDLTAVPKNKAGVGRYLVNLIECLQEIDNCNSYYLFIQDDDLDGFSIYSPSFYCIPVPSRYMRNVFARLVWEQVILPFKLRDFKIDVLHSPHYTMPYFSGVKNVVTFHDMTFYTMPEVHTFLKRLLFRIYIMLSAGRADAILSVSHSTVEDMDRILKIQPKHTFVTPLGVDERFLDTSQVNRNALKIYGIEGEYFLYVGTIEPRKNLLRLLKVYNSLGDDMKSRYKLVICGRTGWMYKEVFDFIDKNGLKDRIIFTGFVKDEYLPYIYKGAKLFIYVSLYEGFGIPLLEAMASGVPCITSNLSSMKEVAGDACLKINPYEENRIKDAIIELLNNQELYDTLREKGMKRAREFTWANCAKKTLDAYMKVYEGVEK